MIKLQMNAAEVNVNTIERARVVMDAFREATQPSVEWGITLYETPDVAPFVARVVAHFADTNAPLGIEAKIVLDQITR
jgi:hypothetical protein